MENLGAIKAQVMNYQVGGAMFALDVVLINNRDDVDFSSKVAKMLLRGDKRDH